MAKIAGYLEQRRMGFSAVVDVPTALRDVVGSKRLKKGLGTRDKHLAQARLPKALLELHSRIDAARRGHPSTDPRTAEAMELRERLQEVRSGVGTVYQPHEVWDPARGKHLIIEAEAAEGLLIDTVQARSEAIADEEGEKRGDAFADLALGRSTPLKHYMETWLAEPGKRGTVRAERTKLEYQGIVTAFEDWLAKGRHASTVEAVTRKIAGEYVSSLHKDGLSAARIRDVCAAFSTYWVWLEKRGCVPESFNPWKGQAVVKVKKVVALSSGEEQDDDEPRPFETEELERLFKDVEDIALRDLMHVAALSGMRIDEACSLTVGQCAEGIFDVRGTKTKAAKRKVPIHPDLSELIKRRCTDKPSTDWLFPEAGEPDKFGKRGPVMSARFYKFRTNRKVDDKPEGQRMSRVNFHSFRRWFVSEAVKAAQPLHVIRQVVGHEQPKSDVTLSTYFRGELEQAKVACVNAVVMPESVRKLLPVSSGQLAAPAVGELEEDVE